MISTIDVVKHVAPRSHENYLEAIRNGDQQFQKHEITTPLRMTR